MNTISPEELQRILEESPPPLVLDVLPEETFAVEHLPGAENACVYEIEFLENVGRISADKTKGVVVYGQNDRFEASQLAFEKLSQAGWTDCAALAGGIEAWKENGGATEGSGQADPLPSGEYQVDLSKSVVRWVGRNLLNQHNGEIPLLDARIAMRDGILSGGRATVDMNGISCHDIDDPSLATILVNHLRSEDFFLADQFPTAEFAIRSADKMAGIPMGAPNYRITGDLHLRGETAEIGFLALVGFNGSSIGIQAQLDIDRVNWGSKYGSGRIYESLGQHLVNDLISISFQLIAPR